MLNRLTSCAWVSVARHNLRQHRKTTGTLAGERLSWGEARRPREPPMRKPSALSVPARGAALILLLSLATAGCVRQLAVQDEYFAPASGSSARSRVATQHLVSHHRALQVAQRSCTAAPVHSNAPTGDARLSAGPEIGSSVAGEALRRLCASIPSQLPVAAHGASSNAYQRWVQDAVRKLPEASETAASAAGGS